MKSKERKTGEGESEREGKGGRAAERAERNHANTVMKTNSPVWTFCLYRAMIFT